MNGRSSLSLVHCPPPLPPSRHQFELSIVFLPFLQKWGRSPVSREAWYSPCHSFACSTVPNIIIHTGTTLIYSYRCHPITHHAARQSVFILHSCPDGLTASTSHRRGSHRGPSNPPSTRQDSPKPSTARGWSLAVPCSVWVDTGTQHKRITTTKGLAE